MATKRTSKTAAGKTKRATPRGPGDEAAAPAGTGRSPDDENFSAVVGQNLKRLRTRHNLSLEGLAKLSAVSRAMLSQIEAGRSVPTINVVWKIARAFGVPFSTMIAEADVEHMRVLRADETKVLNSASGEFSSRALFPFDGERNAEFYELRLKARGLEEADAHAPGTIENLVLVQGVLEIRVLDEVKRLAPGDAILFAADQPHAYFNPGKEPALAYLVMTYAGQKRA